MRTPKSCISLALLGLSLSCRPALRPTPRPAASAPANAAAETSGVTTFLKKDYGPRGTLRVEMLERCYSDRDGTTWHSVKYSFRLLPPGGGEGREISFLELGSDTTVADGEPSEVLLDAELTTDDQLVTVYYTPPQFGGSVYQADILSLEGAANDVPTTAYRHELYAAAERNRLRARVTGSVAGNDLTVSLTGDGVVMRFRFENFPEGRIGWYLMPDGNPPPAADYLAPKLPEPAK